jgi:hypothetical protein
VEEFVFEGDAPSKEVSNAREWTDGIEFGAGELCKWIKCKSVDCLRICE